jgi:hypothetical protein
MPVLYAHSALTHPELGELGSRLLEMPCSKACQVLVLHESHKMHFTRVASAAVTTSIATSNSVVPEARQQSTAESKELSLGVVTRVTINDINFDEAEEDE